MRYPVLGLVLAVLVGAPTLAQEPSAQISELAWMTGHYKGNTDNGTLEEHWAAPNGGSIASLVRSTADGKTNMIELIVIEEDGDSLTLRLKQWDPGMDARSEGFQIMKLIQLGNKKVVFKGTSEDGLQQLGYSLTGDQFTIAIETAQGAFDILLTRQSEH